MHMMMEHKRSLPLMLAILHLLLSLLTLSCVLVPVDAVPVTRLPAFEVQEPTHLNQEDKILKDELIHGRMDFERNDYSGWGANNRHDPRLPGGRD